MPVTDFQGSSTPSHSYSSPFSSFGRSLLSLRRDTPASASAAAVAAAGMPMLGVDPEVEEFHSHVAAQLADLMAGGGVGEEEEFLSIAWIRRLLEAFLLCQEEFRVLAADARRRGALPVPAEKLVAEFGRPDVVPFGSMRATRDERLVRHRPHPHNTTRCASTWSLCHATASLDTRRPWRSVGPPNPAAALYIHA